VTVTLSLVSGKYVGVVPPVNATAAAGPDGNWSVPLPAVPAAAAALLEVTDGGGGRAVLANVAIGELLLCGGQSNMVRTHDHVLKFHEVAQRAHIRRASSCRRAAAGANLKFTGLTQNLGQL
jgi:hypothetical protein